MLRWMNGSGVGLVLSAALGLGTLGCSQGVDTAASGDQQTGAEENGGSAEAGHEHDDEASDQVAVTLAKLSAEDRAAAERQKICPVSGEPLGSMGVPPKVTVEGRDVFICCGGCKDAIEADPEEYLANLDEPAAE